MKFLSLLVLSFACSGMAFGCSEDGSSGIVEDNDTFIPVGVKTKGGITEAEFNNVIDKIEAIYAPVIANRGGKLKIARKWSDGTANANAMRLGSAYNVNMYGGLARHEAITSDGFALVLCHEIGHHIGGAPKTSGFLGLNRWASNEGQADYWATLKCLRQVYLNENNLVATRRLKNVPAALTAACTKAHADKTDLSICVRSGMAGASVANFFASVRKKPEAKFETPDTAVVSKTNDSHPAHQCRLDTYLQGAICEKALNEDVDQKDEVQGTCHGSTGQSVGLRPVCWFKSKK